MSDNNKHCPLCGRFMEKKDSVKYEMKWECPECGVVKIPNRSPTLKWQQMSKG